MDPHRYLEDFEKKAEQLQRQLEASQEAMHNARGQATSPDGSVEVSAGIGGAIEELRLTPKAMQLGHDALGRLIIDTIRTAQAQAAQAAQESMRPMLGDGEAMNFLSEQVESGIAKADAAGTPQEQSRRPAAPSIELDEYDEFDDWNPRGGRR